MPSTLPGFLLLSGLLMFLAGLLGPSFEYKGIKVSRVSKRHAFQLKLLGIGFMVASMAIYGAATAHHVEPPKLSPMLRP